MLKRRPSKRFVLAESGQVSSWDATTDNDPNNSPSINVENVQSVSHNETSQQQSQLLAEHLDTPPITMKHLSVPSQSVQGLK